MNDTPPARWGMGVCLVALGSMFVALWLIPSRTGAVEPDARAPDVRGVITELVKEPTGKRRARALIEGTVYEDKQYENASVRITDDTGIYLDATFLPQASFSALREGLPVEMWFSSFGPMIGENTRPLPAPEGWAEQIVILEDAPAD